MNTPCHFALFGAAAFLMLLGPASAAETTTFESCTNGRGQTLPAEEDLQQPQLVRTVVDDKGQATIHYNPVVLPRLTFNARLFLYSHECAKHGLGDTGKAISVARARLADCIAANTLLDSQVVRREDLPSLQAELSFNDVEWQSLPGPTRNFELTTCRQTRGNVLRLPVDAPPSDRQVGWNNCVRACADRLWTCQKRCGGGECAGCLETHAQCKAACGSNKPVE